VNQPPGYPHRLSVLDESMRSKVAGPRLCRPDPQLGGTISITLRPQNFARCSSQKAFVPSDFKSPSCTVFIQYSVFDLLADCLGQRLELLYEFNNRSLRAFARQLAADILPNIVYGLASLTCFPILWTSSTNPRGHPQRKQRSVIIQSDAFDQA
jgi:hypothetical protein